MAENTSVTDQEKENAGKAAVVSAASTAPAQESSTWLERRVDDLERGAVHMVDATPGVLGAFFQGAFNTPGYKAYWDKYQLEQQERDYNRERMAEWYAGANDRQEATQNALAIQRMQMNALQDAEAAKWFGNIQSESDKNVQDALAATAMGQAMPEQQFNQLYNSNAVKTQRELIAVLSGAQRALQNPQDKEKMLRYMRMNGWDIEEKDGKAYAVNAQKKLREELTPENIQKFRDKVQGMVVEEAKAWQTNEAAAASGKAGAIFDAERARELSVMNGSMSDTLKLFQSYRDDIQNRQVGGGEEGLKKAEYIHYIASLGEMMQEGNVSAPVLAAAFLNSQTAANYLGLKCSDPEHPLQAMYTITSRDEYGNQVEAQYDLKHITKYFAEQDELGNRMKGAVESARQSRVDQKVLAQKMAELENKNAIVAAAKLPQGNGDGTGKGTGKKKGDGWSDLTGGGGGNGESGDMPYDGAFQHYLALHGNDSVNLSSENREKFRNAYNAFFADNEEAVNNALSGYDGSLQSIQKTDIQTLQALQDDWNNIMKKAGIDTEKFPFPLETMLEEAKAYQKTGRVQANNFAKQNREYIAGIQDWRDADLDTLKNLKANWIKQLEDNGIDPDSKKFPLQDVLDVRIGYEYSKLNPEQAKNRAINTMNINTPSGGKNTQTVGGDTDRTKRLGVLKSKIQNGKATAAEREEYRRLDEEQKAYLQRPNDVDVHKKYNSAKKDAEHWTKIIRSPEYQAYLKYVKEKGQKK